MWNLFENYTVGFKNQSVYLLPKTKLQANPYSFVFCKQNKLQNYSALQVPQIYFILQEIIFVFLLQEHNRNQSKRVIDTALRINHIFKIIIKKFTPCPISCQYFHNMAMIEKNKKQAFTIFLFLLKTFYARNGLIVNKIL